MRIFFNESIDGLASSYGHFKLPSLSSDPLFLLFKADQPRLGVGERDAKEKTSETG